MSVRLRDIQAAAEKIRGQVRITPCSRSQTLSEITGAEVHLKFENLQFTASFKERGALNKLLSLNAEQRQRGIAAMSAGNHAQSVAYHAKRLGIPAVIVMPWHTPDVKIERTRSHGAEIILNGDTLSDSAAFTQKLRRERKLTLVHPYDDRLIIAGQGTMGLEMLAQQPELDTLIVPVGGGGMLAGIAVAAKALRPDITLIGVQSERFPAMTQHLRGEQIACAPFTVAEGIAVKSPGRRTSEIIREHVGEMVLVTEREIEAAILMLLQIEKTVVEGAGAAGLAALIKLAPKLRRRKVGIVLSGGNIDLTSLSSIIQRGMVRTGQLVRLRVETRDLPGALAQASAQIGDNGGNIVEVHHQRAFNEQPLQTVVIDFVVRTRGEQHSREIVGSLRDAGCHVALLSDQAAATGMEAA